MAANIIEITDATFEKEVLQSDVPVLIDFWAVWCVPCKMIAPAVDELAAEFQGRLKVCKMDVDTNRNVPPRYGIRGIPTLLLFKGGELKEQLVGALPKGKIAEAIAKHVA